MTTRRDLKERAELAEESERLREEQVIPRERDRKAAERAAKLRKAREEELAPPLSIERRAEKLAREEGRDWALTGKFFRDQFRHRAAQET